MIDVQKLLEPVSSESPCGSDPYNDPGLFQLETLARGEPERQSGTEVIEAKDPNWKELKELCAEFLARSKDLRIGVILSLALLKTDGFPGFRDGLKFLQGLIEQYWDSVYPRLDPEDNNDPTERLNILNNLSSSGEPYRFLLRIQRAPLGASSAFGPVALRDVLVAEGKMSVPATSAEPVLTKEQITALLRDVKGDGLATTHEAIAQSLEALKGIDTFLEEKLGAGRGPNLEELTRNLLQMKSTLAPFVGGISEGGPLAPGEGAEPTLRAAEGRTGVAGQPYSGRIQSRSDVIAVLEQVCDYYRQVEPSSPIPYVAKAAQRLVKMDFMQIMNEVTPDALGWLKLMAEREGSLPSTPGTGSAPDASSGSG